MRTFSDFPHSHLRSVPSGTERERHRQANCKALHPVDDCGKRVLDQMVATRSGRRLQLDSPCGDPIAML